MVFFNDKLEKIERLCEKITKKDITFQFLV